MSHLDTKVRIKNYKSFDSEGVQLDKFYHLNVIIGKNNSGKSSLLDLIEFLTKKEDIFFYVGRDGLNSEVEIVERLNAGIIETKFPTNQITDKFNTSNDWEEGKKFIGIEYTYKLLPQNKRQFVSLAADFTNHEVERRIKDIARFIETPLSNKIFCKINAERNITPEIENTKFDLRPDGQGSTNVIQLILNSTSRESDIIEKNLLDELNIIVRPDISFSRILVQKNSDGKWEVFFENEEGVRVALSKMGSGIKTILLVLLNLIVRPKEENQDCGNYVFAFEELENNLHPSLQRRLYTYVKHFCRNNNAIFFLTTHSNIVIDTFGAETDSQIIHIAHDQNRSTLRTILDLKETKEVIQDLGIKASDLLQSNGIIWVEGPSDRVYINQWLKVLDSNLKEGIHYSIMFYGGKTLARVGFDYEAFDKEVIPLLKINTNSFVVMDRDGQRISSKLNKTKQRIIQEIGEQNYWITKGREIENYLTSNTVTSWLEKNHKIKASRFDNDKNEKIENNIEKSTTKIKYNKNKVGYSLELKEFIKSKDLNILDLKDQLNNLILVIKEWNKE